MIDDGENASGSNSSELAFARSGWQCQSLLFSRKFHCSSGNKLLLVVLLTQAVEVEAHVEEKVEEQLKDGTLETALQAVVDLLRTAPKTVVEFRSSARRRGSRSNRKNKKKTT